jgi:hypothetical protein
VAVWGDSFAPVNPPGRVLQVPHNAAKRPAQAEPLGGLLALLTALYEPDIKAVYVQRGLSDYQSVLDNAFVYVPHDVVVPGVLSVGDICDVVAALAPTPVRLEGLVDGGNRARDEAGLVRAYDPARAAYAAARVPDHLQLSVASRRPMAWLSSHIIGKR